MNKLKFRNNYSYFYARLIAFIIFISYIKIPFLLPYLKLELSLSIYLLISNIFNLSKTFWLILIVSIFKIIFSTAFFLENVIYFFTNITFIFIIFCYKKHVNILKNSIISNLIIFLFFIFHSLIWFVLNLYIFLPFYFYGNQMVSFFNIAIIIFCFNFLKLLINWYVFRILFKKLKIIYQMREIF